MNRYALRNTLSTLALFVVLCLLSGSAFAAGECSTAEGISPRYANIASFYVDLDISKGLTWEASCEVSAMTKSSYTAEIFAELQQKDGTWSTLKSWWSSESSVIRSAKTYNVYSGFPYRVKATIYVYDSRGNLVESSEKYSSTIS